MVLRGCEGVALALPRCRRDWCRAALLGAVLRGCEGVPVRVLGDGCFSPVRIRRASGPALPVAAFEAFSTLGGAPAGLEEISPCLASAFVGPGPRHEIAVRVRRTLVLIALSAQADWTLAGLRVGDRRSFAEAFAARAGNAIVDPDDVFAMRAFGHPAALTCRVGVSAKGAQFAAARATCFAQLTDRVGDAHVLAARRSPSARFVGGAAPSSLDEALARARPVDVRRSARGVAIELFVAVRGASLGLPRTGGADPSSCRLADAVHAGRRSATRGARSATGVSHAERHQARSARLFVVTVHAAASARALPVGRACAPVAPRARLGAAGGSLRALAEHAGASGGEEDEGRKQARDARCA